MNSSSRRRWFAAPLLALALLLGSHGAAQACEGCKSSMSADTAAEGAGKGFAASIYIMLGMPILLIGGIGYMGYKSIRQIEAARRLEATEQQALG